MFINVLIWPFTMSWFILLWHFLCMSYSSTSILLTWILILLFSFYDVMICNTILLQIILQTVMTGYLESESFLWILYCRYYSCLGIIVPCMYIHWMIILQLLIGYWSGMKLSQNFIKIGFWGVLNIKNELICVA